MYYRIITILILVLVMSCESNNEKNIDWENYTGFLKIKNKEGRVVESGYFENGRKVKDWKYYSKKGEFVITWKVEQVSENITVNIPENWKFKVNSSVFTSSGEVFQNQKAQYNLIINENNENFTIEDHYNFLVESMYNKYVVLDHREEKVEAKYILSSFRINDSINDKLHYSLAFITKIDSTIYELSYYCPVGADLEVNSFLFLDMLSNVFVNNKPIFENKYLKELGKADKDASFKKSTSFSVETDTKIE